MHKDTTDFYNIIDKISTALVRRDKKIALFPLWQGKELFYFIRRYAEAYIVCLWLCVFKDCAE